MDKTFRVKSDKKLLSVWHPLFKQWMDITFDDVAWKRLLKELK